MWFCGKARQQPPGLDEEEHCQRVEGGGSSPLLITDDTHLSMNPVLGSPVQDRHGHTGASPAKGPKNDQGSRTSLTGESEKIELFTLEKRKWQKEGRERNFIGEYKYLMRGPKDVATLTKALRLERTLWYII